MYQVIARKYRPRTFAELVGQEHVRGTLANAITQGRIAHGYIFAGQRGTGKTTVARILARCLNCINGPTAEPCLTCAACTEIAAGGAVDVIEIDAASNRGINEMRELRESVRYRPARDRYKVFIIDEAHQITNEAFNALLKTLEEPPEWAVFMLCTTEAHKIPTTIASRCQQFSFRSVEYGELVQLLERICQQEQVSADPETLGVIAQAGDGSVRDSLSALDQAIACCGTKLDAAGVREMAGLFSLDTMGEVAKALEAGDSRRMLEIVQELERNGRHLQHFCRELSRYFRNLLVIRIAGAGSRLVQASAAEQNRLQQVAAKFSEEDLTRYVQVTIDTYRDLQYSPQPRLHLELGLLRLVHAGRLVSIEEALAGLGSAGAPTAGNTPPPSRPAGGGAARTATFGAAGERAVPEIAQPALRTPPSPMAPPADPVARYSPPAAPPPPAESAAPPASTAPSGSIKHRLLAELRAADLKMQADAIDFSEVELNGGEMKIRGPREFGLAVRSAEMREAAQKAAGRVVKITFEPTAAHAPAPVASAPQEGAGPDEATRRALDHPGVQRFQELFPGSHVRTVRDLS